MTLLRVWIFMLFVVAHGDFSGTSAGYTEAFLAIGAVFAV